MKRSQRKGSISPACSRSASVSLPAPAWSIKVRGGLRGAILSSHGETLQMQSESLGPGWFPGSGWCQRLTPPRPLCQSAPSLPSQLSAPGHLCHSVPSLCLAMGQLGRVSAGVCALLQAASWSRVGVGRTAGQLFKPTTA